MDKHQTQTVEHGDDRKQQRVGVGREPADRQVCEQEKDQEGRRVGQQVPAQTLFLVGFDDQQSGTDYDGGEAQQPEFRVAARRHRRGDPHRGLRRGVHGAFRGGPGAPDAAARQSVPGFCGAGGGGGANRS